MNPLGAKVNEGSPLVLTASCSEIGQKLEDRTLGYASHADSGSDRITLDEGRYHL
jgi:hypothetical protein